MKISLKLFASISTLIFLCAANAQTAKPEVEVAPVASASAPAPQEPINFDGVYQRRGPNGNCCYENVDKWGIPKGIISPNLDITISGNSGTFQQFPDAKFAKVNQACHFQINPIEVLEKNGNVINFLIKKNQLNIRGCNDENVFLVYVKVDGKEGFANSNARNIIIYIKKKD